MARAATWLALALAWLGSALGCGEPTAPSGGARSPVAALVADEADEGYARAEVPRDFIFPEDHGPHPDFKTEWWYVTGQLETAAGRRFGIQWTIFRRALAPEMPERRSSWASRQLYMGHVAIADVEGGRHFSAERFARGGAGLAGAEIRPFRVWLEDWQATSASADGLWPLRLQSRAETAAGDDFALDLELRSTKPHVLQGDRGLSRKHEGGASYYYSFTRLAAAGSLELGGRTFEVTGSAWLDREWSTSTLAPDQVGWDWFSLQLDDGRELMFYQLRLAGGAAHPMSAGVLVDVDGTAERLLADQVELEVTARWRSPRSGGVYPAAWRLAVPEKDLELEIEPLLEDQELDIRLRYWEGAVDIRGRQGAADVGGRGYVELVGYAED